MNVLDIAILIIAGLCVLIGFKKGLVKQIFSTCSWIVALALAYFLLNPVYNFAQTETIGTFQPYEFVETKVNGFVVDKLGEFATTAITPENASTLVSTALEQLGLPTFVNNFLTKLLADSELVASATGTLAEYIVPAATSLILTIACFIVIFIVAIIVIKLIGSIFIKLFSGGILGFVNRLAGAALGLVIALIIVNAVMFGLSFLVGMVPKVAAFVNGELAKESIGLASYFYDKNWISLLVANGFDIAAFIDSVKSDLPL